MTQNKHSMFMTQEQTSWNDAKYLYALRTASSFFASWDI